MSNNKPKIIEQLLKNIYLERPRIIKQPRLKINKQTTKSHGLINLNGIECLTKQSIK